METITIFLVTNYKIPITSETVKQIDGKNYIKFW